jgi:hypothetical protein
MTKHGEIPGLKYALVGDTDVVKTIERFINNLNKMLNGGNTV